MWSGQLRSEARIIELNRRICYQVIHGAAQSTPAFFNLALRGYGARNLI